MKGVVILTGEQEGVFLCHNWFSDDLDCDDRGGHAEELIAKHAPHLSGKTFTAYRSEYINGEHVMGEAFCGVVYPEDQAARGSA